MTWTIPEKQREPAPSLDEQIAEVKRELKLRQVVYPAQVERKRMSDSEANDHYLRMHAVLHTLMALKEKA
jgi:hypothetical protein